MNYTIFREIACSILVNYFAPSLKKKQKELEEKEQIYYPCITLYSALKYNIFYTNLLLHPCILKEKDFSDDNEYAEESGLKKELEKVIEYELTETQPFLLKTERDEIIKVFRKLQKKEEKERKTKFLQQNI